VQYDERSMALESGRYFETVGWMSVKLDENDKEGMGSGAGAGVKLERRYLDPNRVTYEVRALLLPG
jgi:hypothetical protein